MITGSIVQANSEVVYHGACYGSKGPPVLVARRGQFIVTREKGGSGDYHHGPVQS